MSKKQPVIEYCFPPELVVAMRVAFLKACEAPQVTDAGGDMTESVAQKILELANAGETCPERLCAGALRKLTH
jgi:hypothetical protein